MIQETSIAQQPIRQAPIPRAPIPEAPAPGATQGGVHGGEPPRQYYGAKTRRHQGPGRRPPCGQAGPAPLSVSSRPLGA